MKFSSLTLALLFLCFFLLSIDKKAAKVNLNHKKTTISKLTKSITNLNSKQKLGLYVGALLDPNWKYEGIEYEKAKNVFKITFSEGY